VIRQVGFKDLSRREVGCCDVRSFMSWRGSCEKGLSELGSVEVCTYLAPGKGSDTTWRRMKDLDRK